MHESVEPAGELDENPQGRALLVAARQLGAEPLAVRAGDSGIPEGHGLASPPTVVTVISGASKGCNQDRQRHLQRYQSHQPVHDSHRHPQH
ncbi:MAG: hypothetical protein ACRDTF_18355 [Pseudonocardiaceae bacterium]